MKILIVREMEEKMNSEGEGGKDEEKGIFER
jgi:hypothetical protein